MLPGIRPLAYLACLMLAVAVVVGAQLRPDVTAEVKPQPNTYPKPSGTLLVTTDLDCDWVLDGVSQGRLKAGDAKSVRVSPGEHLVQAISPDGQDRWQTFVIVAQSAQKGLPIPLAGVREARQEEERKRNAERIREAERLREEVRTREEEALRREEERKREEVRSTALHVAVCRIASLPATSGDASLSGKYVSALGDLNVLASLKSIRVTTEILVGTAANPVRLETQKMRVYPDQFVMNTRTPDGKSGYLEVSRAGAFVQQSDGPKTNLSAAVRDEILKQVRLDRFYVGQRIISNKITVTDTGTERIGDGQVAVLRINVEGAEAIFYVNRANGRVVRISTKVPVMGGMTDSVSDYSDWRNCDGLIVPFQRTITEGGKVSVEKVLTVELNPTR